MRAGLLMAVLLLAACAGASPSLSPTPEPVRKLAEELAIDFFGEPLSVAAATTAADFEAMWGRFGRSEPPPDVDFEREMVVYLGMAGSSSCPETFVGLVVDLDAGRVFGQWQSPPGPMACTDDLQSQGVLLAVSRSELPPDEFVLTLREQLVCADCAEHPDQAVVTL
jgi:hypothetical protein